MLEVGDKVPVTVALRAPNDADVTLAEYLGQYLVIYFYPQDDTEACTVEACSFRDYNAEIENLGAKVIGISKDNQQSHSKFREKFSLNFLLLSDIENKLQEAFGVWGEKTMFGRTFMGTLRTTFLVSPQGEIVYVWPAVKAEGHAAAVYTKLKEIIHAS